MTRLLLSCSQQRTPLRSLSLRRGSAATVGRIAQGEPRPDVWARAADIPQTALTDTSRDAEESVVGDLEPMKEEKEFVKAELVRSMESGKLTRERYADGFTFKDPIASVSGLSNYSLYLGALNAIINTKCECRSVSVRNDRELLVEWTTTLRPKLPLIDPLVLTGRSIYELDDAAKVKSIQGVWDALENNDFPSLEGVAYLISSLIQGKRDAELDRIEEVEVRMVPGQVRLTPELETPRYRILRRLKEYEVREYEPFVVAEVAMPKGSNAVSGAGFTKLAAYTFGSNEESVRMEMTTPVYTTPGQGPVRGKMSFVMEEKYWQDPAALPTPKASDVQTGTQYPRLTAAICFSGFPLNSEVSGNEQRLRKLLEEDGLKPEPGFQLARYNEPTAPPFLRRNEVLIKLADVSELPQPPRSPRS